MAGDCDPTSVTGGAPRCLPRGVAGCEVGDDGGEGDLSEQPFGFEHAEGNVLHEGVDADDHIRVVEVESLGHLPESKKEEFFFKKN